MRWSVVLLALAVSAPSLYDALWVQDVPVSSAVIHFLIAVPIIAVLSAIVQFAMKSGSRAARSTDSLSPPTD